MNTEDANFHLSIAEIELTNGLTIRPPQAGVTAIVGGNNVGKSTLLRELRQVIQIDDFTQWLSPKAVSRVYLRKNGSGQAAYDWMRANRPYAEQGGQTGVVVNGTVITSSWGIGLWESSLQTLHFLANAFVYDGDVHNRFAWSQPATKRPDIRHPASHPLHHLERDGELLQKVRDLSNAIFRQELTLDHLSGQIKLRAGKPDVVVPLVDSISSEYYDALAALDPLDEQGDGIKSLMGLALPLLTMNYPLVMIDEPEAFLHPPQARALGRFLGDLANHNATQVFVATHDRNLLLGLLESDAPTSVVRLDRTVDQLHSHQLEADAVGDLWNDAVFRYSNVLEGLFHRAVVVAEGDRDCRFYAASLDAARELTAEANKLWPYDYTPGDILFVPANGKDGFPRIIAALRAVAVPVVGVCDLDVLSDRGKVEKLYTSLGHDWESVSSSYSRLAAPFAKPRSERTNAEVLELVRRVLSSDPTNIYDTETEALAKSALRTERSPWAAVKEYGRVAFKKDAAQAFEEFDSNARRNGMVLVHEGELECIAPHVNRRKGPDWLREALEIGAHRSAPAQQHIGRVADSLTVAIGRN